MSEVLYGVLAFSIAMVGVAFSSLYTSPDERMNRESFLYNYAAFIAYIIIALIGFVVVIQLYQSGLLLDYAVIGVVGPAVASTSGPFVGYLTGLFASKGLRDEGYLPTLPENKEPAVDPYPKMRKSNRKYRRQIGYGRYHA